MKRKILLILLILCLLLPTALSSCSFGEPVRKLYVYNWGEYLSLETGEDGVHVNHAFEAWYEAKYGEKVEVVYSVFSSNEEMYAKLQNGASRIDLIVPSEYMVERLIAEDMLLPLDYSRIPLYEETIEQRFQEMTTKPYCVPYTYGYLGLIYDASIEEALHDENGEVSWRVLWNQLPDPDVDLSGNILSFNNSRDAFGIAQFLLNYEKSRELSLPLGTDLYVNSTDRARWDEVYDLLCEQRGVLQAYVMDEIYNKMESGAALLSAYYAGDYFTMVDVNENLCFSYPKEGTNFFYDAMCIPKNAKNADLAHAYISFMLGGNEGETLDTVISNAEWVGYSSPNLLVSTNPDYLADMIDEEEGYGADALSILYPDTDTEALLSLVEPYAEWRAAEMEENDGEYDMADYEGALPDAAFFAEHKQEFVTYIYENLDNETLEYANGRWEALKLASAPCTDIYVTSAVITILLLGIAFAYFLLHRYRARFY